MDAVHASDEIIAQGSIVPRPSDEEGKTESVELPTLYLDTDSKFRWYDAGAATEAAGSTLRTAIEAARLKWPRLQVVMLQGKPVVHLTDADVPNVYAADELDRARKSKEEV